MNIVEHIRRETQSVLNRTAVVEGEKTISYRDLLGRIETLREALKSRVIPGQRIAFRCSDGIDYIVGALALLDCDAAVVPVPDTLTTDEIAETIARIDVHGVLVHTNMTRTADENSAERVDDVFLHQTRRAGSEMDERCRTIGAAFIRFSSGTTGESKGVVLSHQSIVERTDAANRGLNVSEKDTILWVLGMAHHFVVSILLFLRKGATIIVANQGFPFSVLEAAQKHPITFIYGSPVHYFLLSASDVVVPNALANVRMAISTAMKMPAEVSEKFSAKFGIVPVEAYGIIEIGLPFINTDTAEARDAVGQALPDYRVRIANADKNGIGEVLVRGKGMFDAYFSPWRLREECLDDGWFHTGDVGRVDEKGRLFLVGRSKTVIVCAGMKVFPEEVEQVINSIAGVGESLVFGREHPQFGHVPVAKVVVSSDVADWDAFAGQLRGDCFQKLSSYKVPVEFVRAESLAKTPSGKIARAI